MKVADNTVVTVSYIMTDDEDKVVGRSDAKNPVVMAMKRVMSLCSK